MKKRLAIIVAHPDDEALGCGGTILKLKKTGSEIHLLALSKGFGSRIYADMDAGAIRNKGFEKALEFLTPTSHALLDYPDNQMDSVPLLNIIQSIESFIKDVNPHTIITHSPGDLNIDHVLTCRAVMTATRPGGFAFVPKIYGMEVPSSTEWSIGPDFFSPDTFVDITQTMDEKMEYLSCYDDEMRPFPHPRSYDNVRALNQLRGAHVCVPYAEAFVTLRNMTDEL